jgi:type IV pilus assembly protein PilB
MKLDQNKIREILLEEKYVKKEDAKKADDFVKNKKGNFLEYFMSQGILNADLFGQAIAEFFKVSYIDLNTNIPEKDLVLEIPEEIAKKFRIILCAKTETTVTVATDDPSNKSVEEEVGKLFGNKKIVVGFSLSEDIDFLLLFYKKTLTARFNRIILAGGKIAPEIIDEIINDALDFKASDIHFELEKKDVVIRFRIDGFLHEAGRIPIEYYENILNRVKLQASMRTDEHFSAQDGVIRYEKNGRTVDMRISVVPAVDGEKIVIRLLVEYAEKLTLNDIGFSKEQQKFILNVIKKPSGMVLVAGPTGSGKTTTLYALLKYLNKPEISIATIEDPVEYKMPGVNHIQVNSSTNLTFAEGLKSIVRQDPDIILVGEIRDKETASIAVNAALTGHLLFSTFHANDVVSVILRFLEMGVDAVQLSSSLRAIVLQRLVRKVCEKCRYSYEISIKDLSEVLPNAERFFAKDTVTLYKGKGCSNCSGTGYSGRTAIFEAMGIGPELEQLMRENPSLQQIRDIEKQQKVIPLFDDGLEKVKSGTTTIEELLRVADVPQ